MLGQICGQYIVVGGQYSVVGGQYIVVCGLFIINQVLGVESVFCDTSLKKTTTKRELLKI